MSRLISFTFLNVFQYFSFYLSVLHTAWSVEICMTWKSDQNFNKIKESDRVHHYQQAFCDIGYLDLHVMSKCNICVSKWYRIYIWSANTSVSLNNCLQRRSSVIKCSAHLSLPDKMSSLMSLSVLRSLYTKMSLPTKITSPHQSIQTSLIFVTRKSGKWLLEHLSMTLV